MNKIVKTVKLIIVFFIFLFRHIKDVYREKYGRKETVKFGPTKSFFKDN